MCIGQHSILILHSLHCDWSLLSTSKEVIQGYVNHVKISVSTKMLLTIINVMQSPTNTQLIVLQKSRARNTGVNNLFLSLICGK